MVNKKERGKSSCKLHAPPPKKKRCHISGTNGLLNVQKRFHLKSGKSDSQRYPENLDLIKNVDNRRFNPLENCLIIKFPPFLTKKFQVNHNWK